MIENLDRSKVILVWRFQDAPLELQRLSTHGGDEDWIAFVPNMILEEEGIIWWLEPGTPFGRYKVSEHELEDGVVFIGAHA